MEEKAVRDRKSEISERLREEIQDSKYIKIQQYLIFRHNPRKGSKHFFIQWRLMDFFSLSPSHKLLDEVSVVLWNEYIEIQHYLIFLS